MSIYRVISLKDLLENDTNNEYGREGLYGDIVGWMFNLDVYESILNEEKKENSGREAQCLHWYCLVEFLFQVINAVISIMTKPVILTWLAWLFEIRTLPNNINEVTALLFHYFSSFIHLICSHKHPNCIFTLKYQIEHPANNISI